MTLHSRVPLGDVAEFIRGITFKPDDIVPLGTDGSVVCMRTKNVQQQLDCDDLLSIPIKFVRRENQFLAEGDILVSSANSWNLVGKCSWIPALPWKTSFGGFVSVLRANPKKVFPRYLYWWFSSRNTQALLRSFGQKTTNISNLNIERCLGLDLPLPSLQEQRRIATILDKADTLRVQRREALAQLDSLAQSIFVDMFGDPKLNPMTWPTKSLKELGKVITGGTPSSSINGMFGGEIPFVTPGDLESEAPVRRTVTEAGAQETATVRAGSTFVCCIGATIGKIGKATVRSSFNQQLNAVEWNQQLVKDDFGLSVLRFFKPTIIAWGASTTLPILKKSSFEKIEVPVPPIELQQRFCEIVTSMEKIRHSHKAHLEETENLFSSLQAFAFTGEL